MEKSTPEPDKRPWNTSIQANQTQSKKHYTRTFKTKPARPQ